VVLLALVERIGAEGLPQAPGTGMKRQGAGGIGAAAKRKKIDAKASNPLLDTLLAQDSERRKALSHKFSSAGPFPHIVLKPLCPHKRLEDIFNECTHNLNAELKDTDKCRFFQTCKLEELEELSNSGPDEAGKPKVDISKLPGLIALRDSLYSKEMRALVEEVTDCGELADTKDCTIDIFNQGCFRVCGMERPGSLLGARVIRFEAYLSSPDEEWIGGDGGAVQMFASGSWGVPRDVPSAEIAPFWNTMLLYEVGQRKPTYTAVEEVFSDKTRMCISGYYHSTQVAADMPVPPVAKKKGDTMEVMPLITEPFKDLPEEPSVELPEKDIEYLSKFVSPEYLKADNLVKIREKFAEDSSTVLTDFLLKDLADKITVDCIQADVNDNLGHDQRPRRVDVGVWNGWTVTGPPNERRFAAMVEGGQDIPDALGQSLKTMSQEVFFSGAFGRLLGSITGLRVLGGKKQVRRFRAGLDYACASGNLPQGEYVLDAVLPFIDDRGPVGSPSTTEDITSGKKSGKEAMAKEEEGNNADDGVESDAEDATKGDVWESGVVGGFACYVEATDPYPEEGYSTMGTGGKDADEDEEGGPLIKCMPQSNALCIALRDAGVLKFVKYISSGAPGSRWDTTATYKVDGAHLGEDDEDASEAEGKSSSSAAGEAKTKQ